MLVNLSNAEKRSLENAIKEGISLAQKGKSTITLESVHVTVRSTCDKIGKYVMITFNEKSDWINSSKRFNDLGDFIETLNPNTEKIQRMRNGEPGPWFAIKL